MTIALQEKLEGAYDLSLNIDPEIGNQIAKVSSDVLEKFTTIDAKQQKNALNPIFSDRYIQGTNNVDTKVTEQRIEVLADLSKLIYEDQPEFEDALKDKYGIDKNNIFFVDSDNGAEGALVLVESPQEPKRKHLIMVTRGTDSFQDAITDAKVSAKAQKPYGPLHRGVDNHNNTLFNLGMQSVCDHVMKKFPDTILEPIGHSLGGAVSEQATLAFSHRYKNAEIYNTPIAAPRNLSPEAAEYARKHPNIWIDRVIAKNDLVHNVPSTFLGFEHPTEPNNLKKNTILISNLKTNDPDYYEVRITHNASYEDVFIANKRDKTRTTLTAHSSVGYHDAFECFNNGNLLPNNDTKIKKRWRETFIPRATYHFNNSFSAWNGIPTVKGKIKALLSGTYNMVRHLSLDSFKRGFAKYNIGREQALGNIEPNPKKRAEIKRENKINNSKADIIVESRLRPSITASSAFSNSGLTLVASTQISISSTTQAVTTGSSGTTKSFNTTPDTNSRPSTNTREQSPPLNFK